MWRHLLKQGNLDEMERSVGVQLHVDTTAPSQGQLVGNDGPYNAGVRAGVTLEGDDRLVVQGRSRTRASHGIGAVVEILGPHQAKPSASGHARLGRGAGIRAVLEEQ